MSKSSQRTSVNRCSARRTMAPRITVATRKTNLLVDFISPPSELGRHVQVQTPRFTASSIVDRNRQARLRPKEKSCAVSFMEPIPPKVTELWCNLSGVRKQSEVHRRPDPVS